MPADDRERPRQRNTRRRSGNPRTRNSVEVGRAIGSTADSPATGIAAIAVPKIIALGEVGRAEKREEDTTRNGRVEKKPEDSKD